jgi:putative endonuclease
MFIVYILYSASGNKTYTGFTTDVERRLYEHNITESSGFTLRYRPWTLIHTEIYNVKQEAMAREKFLKTGRGRDIVKEIVKSFLNR